MTRRCGWRLLPAAILFAAVSPGMRADVQGSANAPASTRASVKIGSKAFTESVILGEIATGLLRAEGFDAVHRKQLGGTRILWEALLAGEIDAYPEYTGTISEEILAGRGVRGEEAIREALARQGIEMTRSLGFNDTYALGMKLDLAERLEVRTISDLSSHPDLAFGFSSEFIERSDGWPGLRDRYRLPQSDVRGLDHDLAYRGLQSGSIAVTDLYSTDAEIAYYGLRILEDDLAYFPAYRAVLLVRSDLRDRAPGALEALTRLEGRISETAMIGMNAEAKLEKIAETRVGASFLEKAFGISGAARDESFARRLARRTREHLGLVALSLAASVIVAVPLGILAARRPAIGQATLGVVGVIQTIPSLALLVFMIPLLGIGAPPAIFAMFLYSLLPIVRNTFVGLRDIPGPIRESAEALGLPARARLRLVELPMASRAILAGVKTAAVINVGTATLGALVGAGGYGQPILTGIRLDNIRLILEGAVPAALLALLVQGLFELTERALVPKGLRL